ncbi:trace amine-associated receptor 4-like [Thalassophryne amazonica]|uniref:trace amine-associated receptor 4-like n=1 Tax=Thalassophryne amazonica TaxID=390379 RepID=UPI0014711CEA|nr:trace amine-associated receptor 4-like [Thalassophryne amazonica]
MMETKDGAELCFPELLNTSCRKPAPPGSEAVLGHILMSSVSVLTVTLNLLVIISVSHFRQLHFPSNLLLLSLAVSDFLVGLLVLPSEIFRQSACWFLGDLMCSLYNYVTLIITSASVGDMVLISVDRYVAVCDPLHYSTRVTVRRVQTSICMCWFTSVCYCGLISKGDLTHPGRPRISCFGECVIVMNDITGVVDLVVTFISPISVIVVLYVRVFVVAVSQARAMRSHVTALTHKPSVNVRTKKSELKAARALGVVVVFIICFCPYYCVFLAGENLLNAQSGAFVLYVFYFNSCINPVIYALFYP